MGWAQDLGFSFRRGALVLASSVACEPEASETVTAFYRLFRSVSYDFKYYANDTQCLIERANLCESCETAREYFGLTGLRPIKLVEDVTRLPFFKP